MDPRLLERIQLPTGKIDWQPSEYAKHEDKLAKQLECVKTARGWWVTKDNQVLTTTPIVGEMLKRTHDESHMGADVMVANIK